MSDDTPMEAGPLRLSPHDESHEAMIIRNRRLMRREYSKNYGQESEPIPQTEPVQFVDRSGWTITERPKEPMSPYWTGLVHGFCLALGLILGITAFILWRF